MRGRVPQGFVFDIQQLVATHLAKQECRGGGGATRLFPRDGNVEELHGDLTVGPRPNV